MIRLHQYDYNRFSLARVQMDAGSVLRIAEDEASRSVAVICTKGGTVAHEMDDEVRLPQDGEGLVLNNWSSDDVGRRELNLRAPADTEWVCVAENGHGRPQVSLRTVDGQDELAPGSGLILLDGEISAGSVQVPVDGYYQPRDYPSPLSGRGRILELTWPTFTS